MTIDATSTSTTPGGLLIGWAGNFNVAMTSGTLTTGASAGDMFGTFGLTIGESGTGTFSQTGGLVTAPLVNLGRVVGGVGFYTLTGGTLSAAKIVKGNGAGSLNLNGGTIRVSGTAASLIGATVSTTLQSGGGIIDTNGFDATIPTLLSGSGGITKNGFGTLLLAAANSYTGGNVINGGTLQIGNNTALLLPALGGYVLNNGASLAFSLNGMNNSSGVATITGTGNVVFMGEATTGNWYSTGAFAANGLTYTGTTTISLDNAANGLYIEATPGKALPNTTILQTVQGFVNLRQDQTVSGLAGPGGMIRSESAPRTLTVNVTAGASYTSAAALQEPSGTLNLTKSGAGTQILTGSSTYTGATTITGGTLQIGSGTTGSLSASSVITGSAGGTLAFGRTDNYGGVFGNAIGGGIGVVLKSGTLTLAGANTFTGTTRIMAGGLSIGSALALQNSTLDLNAADAGVISSIGQDSTLGGLTGSRDLDMAGRTLSIGNNNASTTYSGVLSNGGLTKMGTGALVLTGSNSYTGATTITGGTLQIGDGGTAGSIAANASISSGATLAFNLSSSVTYSGMVTGAGGLVKAGAGTVTLSGSSTYTGATTITGGTLQIGDGGTAGSIAANASISSGATLAFNLSSSLTYSGMVTGAGGLVKAGAGTVTLSGSNTYTGATTITGGTLQIGSNNATTALPTGNVAVAAAAKAVFSRNIDNVAFTTQSISGAGGVEFQGQADGYYAIRSTGPTYSGALSYTGQTIVNLTATATGANAYRGSLWLEKDNVLPSATVLNMQSGKVYTRNQTGTGISVAGITGSAGTFITTDATGGTQKWTVTVASGTTYTFAGTIGWDGQSFVTAANGNQISFNKAGAGSQILSGSNTYTGATTISAGRLQIDSAGSINNSSGITVNGAGAEFKYNSATALTAPLKLTQGTLSGTGSINTPVSIGANVILSPGNSPGAQTYSSGTFAAGGSYTWEINNWASGTAGVNFDQANFTNGLAITSSSASPFTINLTSLKADNTAGAVPGFNNGLTGLSFTIAKGAMTGFSPSVFTLGTSGFFPANTVSGSANGGFWLSTDSGSSQLVLNYAPSARYTLSATPAATAIYAGGTTTITGAITNSTADRTGADVVQFSNLSVGTGSLSVTSGTLASGSATNGTVNFTSGTVGQFTFTPTVSATNVNLGTAALAGTVTSSTVTVYNMAAAASSQTVNVGTFHVGDSGGTATKAFSLTNTAPVNASYTETLASGSFSSTSTGYSATGSVSGIAGGTSASGSLLVGFSTGSAGARNGSTVLSLNSQAVNSSGLGTTGFATQTITITGGVFSGNGVWNLATGGSWGTGASSNWTSAESVSAAPGTFGGFTNTDSATFGTAVSSGTATIDLSGVTPSLKSITFSSGSASYLLSGGAITLLSNTGTAGLSVGAGTHEIASNLTLSSLTSVDIAAGSLLTLFGTIGGSGGLVKTNAGELDLKAANTYSGNTAINAGTLKIFDAGAFSSGTVTLASGATLDLDNLTITNTLVNLGGTIINSGSYTGSQTVTGNATFIGTTAGTITVNNGGSATFSGPVAASVTVNNGGSATVSGAVASTGTFTVNANSILTAAQGSSFAAGSMISNAGQLKVTASSGTTSIASTITGAGDLIVNGGGLVRLTGSSGGFTGQTTVSGNGTTLSVNGFLGSSNVTVNAGAVLGGSGKITGTVGGDGLIGPGNSPGILTVSQVAPTSLTSFAFEFTQTGDPIWSSGTASGNDVLQITDLKPFVTSLTGSNVVNVYLEVASLTNGEAFRGGFFSNYTSGTLDFAGAIGAPIYQFFVMGSGSGSVSYNGHNYYALSDYLLANPGLGITGVSTSVVTVPTADFSGGTITNGQVTQFVIIPEPDTVIFAGIGTAMAGWSLWKRRRIA